MYRGVQRKRKSKFSPPKLMLTSMMDMFTIILIFLLFSFSDDPKSLDGMKDLELPESSAETNYADSIRIILSSKELKLNDEALASVDKEIIVGMDSEHLEKSELFNKLRELYDAEKEREGVEDKSRHVLFLCDKGHSFKTINNVIKAAGLAGFPNFQFAVLEGG